MRFKSILIATFCAPLCFGAVKHIQVSERSGVLDGKSFGPAGPYERVIGKAFFAVDPKDPANRNISDIDRAPLNEDGLVEFSADLYVLKPREPKNGNSAVLLEIPNRGGKGMLAMYDRAAGSLDPRTAEQFGDNFLLQEGYTLVWLGWQFDVPQREGLLRLYAPAAKGITGLVRSEFVPDRKTDTMPLADRSHLAYPVVKPGDLTVRDRATGPRTKIPASQWRLNGSEITMAPGFIAGKIYEFVYTAKDPVLVGLGPTAVRDIVSFLKYGGGGPTTGLGNDGQILKRAYGFGVSQSGRFLRQFLYDGFNADESNRKVFDGILAHVAGAGHGSFNYRFAQPSRDGHPFMNMLYPTDIFPFTDLEETDPETGATGALLMREQKSNTVPKIFYTNSSYEYWGRSAALIHASPDGKKDIAPPDSTRIYFFAGGQHGPASFPPPKHDTQNMSSPNDYRWSMRALLIAMDHWVRDDSPPPPSQYPKVGQDSLVTLGAVQFPKIPGVTFPMRMQKAYRADYGPDFQTAHVIRIEPPKVGSAFPALVPQVDRDGIDMGGIRMPEVAAPLATYTGWNLRAPEIGAPDELYSMVGSFIPFAKTKAERQTRGDPRLSIEERYRDRAAFLEQVTAAARDLVGKGFLLERDVPKLVERSATEWDQLVGQTPGLQPAP